MEQLGSDGSATTEQFEMGHQEDEIFRLLHNVSDQALVFGFLILILVLLYQALEQFSNVLDDSLYFLNWWNVCNLAQ